VSVTRPLVLGRATDIVNRFAASLRTAHSGFHRIEAAGDLRRAESLISSIVIVASADDPRSAAKSVSTDEGLGTLADQGDARLIGRVDDANVQVHIVTPEDFGARLFHATGSAEHVRQVISLGLQRKPFATEDQLYASVGLPFIPPELRDGRDEIDAARSGRLPALVWLDDMRGDLHMHSTYSDGRDPLEIMVEGCDALGYEYIAITDHSAGSAASRTLSVDDIARQRDDIEALRARYPRMAILHGCEVDILPNGSLDFDDSVLERFDIVLASLHQRDGHDGARLTTRTLQTLRHPLVNILCHPANRLPGSSTGYPLDFEAIYAAAAETGTALEIDGSPSHLDLDGEHARAAIAAGVTLTIDSDCHRVDALRRQMSFGVGLARRGWIEARHVLNTRPIAGVRAFIEAKRRGDRS
jgi:DNA polymerase (family 10)